MADGDGQFADDIVERKILQAIVATSAADTLQWIQTRVPDGNAIGKPLEELAPVLQKGNIVGAGLDSAQEALVKQAKSAITNLMIGATVPVWLGAVVAFVAGVFGFAQQAGAQLGATLIPLLVGGGGAAAALVRGVLQVSPAVTKGVGGAATSLWAAARARSVLGPRFCFETEHFPH